MHINSKITVFFFCFFVLACFVVCSVFRWKAALEAKYKEELDETFGIQFNNLFTITNMPIKVAPLQNRGSIGLDCFHG